MSTETQNCQPDLLESFLNGDLDRVQELQLTEHLESCGVCRQSLESTAAEPNRWLEASRLLKPTRFDWNPGGEPDASDCSDLLTPIPLQIRNVLDSLAPSEDPKMLGQLGGYQITGVVGAGAMGVVLKAADKSLDRTVAIKVLSPHLASSGAARKRFAREAKAAAAVLHPNVIAIHGVSNDQTMPHLVMPYVRGTSLQKRINDDGSLPVNEVLRIGAQVAAGLAAAHAQGLVHRDIKPANILLEEGVERVAITDFGLARAVDDASLTRTGIIAGTPQYMSPEQSRGESVDQRSDLFSLGSVMYAMCTGRPPFRCETTYGVIQRINNDQPTSIREINPDVPDWLAQIIERLMSKQAEDRFESADEVSDLLEQCLAHVQQPSSVSLPDAAVIRPNPSWTNKPPAFWGVVVASVATAIFLACSTMFLWGGPDPPEIGGKWIGDRWGDVELKQTQPGQYVGTYGDGSSKSDGTIQLKWSRFEGRFNGTWGTGETKKGEISVQLDNDVILGASTNTSETLTPGTPRLAELQWNRPQAVEASGSGGSIDGIVKSLEYFDARKQQNGGKAGNPDSQQEAEVIDVYQVYSINSKHRGWKAVMQCLTDDCRDELSMEYLFALTQMAENELRDDDKKAHPNEFLEFLHKEFPTLAEISSRNQQSGEWEFHFQKKLSSPDAEERRQVRLGIFRTMTDSENESLFKMLSEVISRLDGDDKWQAKNKPSKLVDVEVRGTDAFAVIDSRTKENRQSLAFKRINGSWKLDRLVSKNVFDEMAERDQLLKTLRVQQKKALKTAQATHDDIAAAMQVANKFVTASLGGRRTEAEKLLSPSHAPTASSKTLSIWKPFVSDKNFEFTEAYINQQDQNDMLLVGPEFENERIANHRQRLMIGMKRENGGWRVSEVLPTGTVNAGKLIEFYEIGKPLLNVYRFERDIKGLPTELQAAATAVHNARLKLRREQDQGAPKDKLESLRSESWAAYKEFDRIYVEIRNRKNRENRSDDRALSERKRNREKRAQIQALPTELRAAATVLHNAKTKLRREKNPRERRDTPATKDELESLRLAVGIAQDAFDTIKLENQKGNSEEPTPKESQADAFKELLGTWSLVGRIGNRHHGRKPGRVAHEFKQYDLTFSENEHNAGHSARLVYESESSRNESSNRVTLNSNASPKEINIFGEGFLIQGVYECADDTLKIAYWGTPEFGRPSSLEATPKSLPSHTVWVFKRNATPKANIKNKDLSESPPEVSDASDSPSGQLTQEVNYGGTCVRDDDGRPIADAMVRLFLYRKSDSEFVLAEIAHTDEQGRFSIRGSVGKEFDLSLSRVAISSPGRATSVLLYQETGKASPTRKLVAPASITGQVTDSQSKPVDGATVIHGHLPGVWQARTDLDGRFEISDVPPADELNWERVSILMAVHPDLKTLTTTTIKSVPANVEIQLRDIPVVPSPLARAARDALTHRIGIQGNWKMKSQEVSNQLNQLGSKLEIPSEEFDAADVRWWFDESQMSLRRLNTHWVGNRVTRSERSDEIIHDYQLLPKGKIVLKKLVEGEPVKTVAGKYRLRGDQLWVALPSRDDRPVKTAANATGKEQQRGVDYFSFERADPVRITAPAQNLFFDNEVPADVAAALKKQSGKLSMQEAFDLYAKHVKPAVIWATHGKHVKPAVISATYPTNKRREPVMLKLVIFEDGIVIAEGPDAWRGELSQDELHELMHFIRDEQKFSEIRSFTKHPKVVLETLHDPSKAFHESIQVGSKDFKVQPILSESESGEIKYLQQSEKFKRITRRLRRIKGTTVIGGQDEQKFYLDFANDELNKRFPDARPLTLDDEFSVVVSKASKSENSRDSRWIDFWYPEPRCIIQIKHEANEEPRIRNSNYFGSSESD